MKLDYRLALDLGTNSIGWCVYRLANDAEAHDERERWRITSIQRMGARIFSDGRNPKNLASMAADRRLARQQRRRRDRALKRKQRFMDALIHYGLLPADDAERKGLVDLDPYQLRASGLNTALHPYHFGRALFHLARKRGFRSGRKDFSTDDKEAGKIKDGIKRLKAHLLEAGCATVGAYLASLHAERKPVLARPASDGSYPIYLDRELVTDEFDALWSAQARLSPDSLKDEARIKLRDIMLFQRPLRPVVPGKCLFEPEEPRAQLAHPLAQRFRILQELANLRVQHSPRDHRPLSREQRDAVFEVLTHGGKLLGADQKMLTWAKLRVLLALPKDVGFNLDISGRKGLKADSVSIALCNPQALGEGWRRWSVESQDKLLRVLRVVDRPQSLGPALRKVEFDIRDDQLQAIFHVAATMPDDFGNVSLKALIKIVPELAADTVHYDEAVKRAGYRSHSDFYDGELWPQLPYYGQRLISYVQPRDLPGASPEERQFGRISNPTVHVGLNQLRRIVNAIVKRYGHPKQIIIEVARELGLSGQNRRELESEQRKNRENNEKLGQKLVDRGLRNNRENRQRLQLFEELTRGDPLGAECIYTGERISPTRLFSGDVDVDHILPFSRSLDDGMGNKLLCVRRANRDKAQKTPFEAFGSSPGNYQWQEIVERVERLIPRKAKRFREQAMEEFLKDRDFLDRHLTDTAYFSRVAREYLTCICPPNCVWVSTGKLTAMLRGRWGLNAVLSDSGAKDRNDHRHHAVDAAVIGACDRRLISAMATAAARAEREGEHRLLERIDPPWPSFFDDVRQTTHSIFVSHKPEHGLGAALHNETVYGLAGPADEKGRKLVARRGSILDINSEADLEKLADQGWLRTEIQKMIEQGSAAEIKQSLIEFSRRTGVRRVRLLERMTATEIKNPRRDEPKLVKTDGNYCYDIVRDPKGRWRGGATTFFDATRIAATAEMSEATSTNVVMRLRKSDTVAIEESGKRRVMKIQQFSAGKILLAEHFEANVDGRHRENSKRRRAGGEVGGDTFELLQVSEETLRKLRGRIAFVDELGYVNDPGFRE